VFTPKVKVSLNILIIPIYLPDITKLKCKKCVNKVKRVSKTSQLTTHDVLGVVTAKVFMQNNY